MKGTMPIKPPRKLDKNDLREYAHRLLAGRALSIGDFREKLRRRAAELGSVDELVNELKEMGALNDPRFAEHFAGVRAGSGSFGRQRVLSDLIRKKVAPKVAEKAVSDAFLGTNEAVLVEEWLQKKYRTQNLGELLQDPNKLASVYRRLRQAGFSTGPSIKVLKRFAAQAEELEGLEDAPEL